MPDNKRRVIEKEKIFLSGRKPLWKELKMLISVAIEFFSGVRKLRKVGPCVTVYGSARLKQGDKYYKKAEELGAEIAKMGFTVMTGGGPGIMEAAVKGAKSQNGKTVGCNITLPYEQYANDYLDTSIEFQYFFVRKVMLTKYAYAFIALPGGFGTFDELFEALTLIQTRKTKQLPVILIGKEYYANLIHQMETMIENGTINKEDINLFLYTDDIEEVVTYIKSKVDLPRI